jgi:hypothetical protein
VRWSSTRSQLELDYLELDGIDACSTSRKSRVIALLNLIRLSYADGAFDIEEECLLKEISRTFEVSDATSCCSTTGSPLLALEDEARSLMAG